MAQYKETVYASDSWAEKLRKRGFERGDPSGGAEFTGELFLYL